MKKKASVTAATVRSLTSKTRSTTVKRNKPRTALFAKPKVKLPNVLAKKTTAPQGTIEDRFIAALIKGPLRPTQLAKMLGISPASFYRVAASLKEAGRIEAKHLGREAFYHLAVEARPARAPKPSWRSPVSSLKKPSPTIRPTRRIKNLEEKLALLDHLSRTFSGRNAQVLASIKEDLAGLHR